jgi:hypothetical protein
LSAFFASPAVKTHQIKKHVLFISRPLAEENTLEKLKIMRVSVRAAPPSQTKAEGIFMVNGVLVVGL